MKNNQKIKLFS